jgi:hypothetical protein
LGAGVEVLGNSDGKTSRVTTTNCQTAEATTWTMFVLQIVL